MLSLVKLDNVFVFFWNKSSKFHLERGKSLSFSFCINICTMLILELLCDHL